MKPCEQHGRHEAKIETLEKSIDEFRKDIKELSAKMNKFTGAVIVLAAIPVIIKVLEFFTPIARAMGK
jgi:hypothetical protein